MAGNHEDAIRRALDKGDVASARAAYDDYVKSMRASKQTPKPQSYFGIPR